MKIDIDSIFYIILSIIILVVTGLGSRRRKQAQQMRPSSPRSVQPRPSEPDENNASQEQTPVVDPFARLEQILTGQTRYESLEGESIETLEDEEEMINDEMEKYATSSYLEQEEEEPDLTVEKEEEHKERPRRGLFGDMNEVTRAVIYSEILPRKYT